MKTRSHWITGDWDDELANPERGRGDGDRERNLQLDRELTNRWKLKPDDTAKAGFKSHMCVCVYVYTY